MLKPALVCSTLVIAASVVTVVQNATQFVVDSVYEITHDPQVEISWYDIRGRTATELREQLERFGPIDQYGKRRDAYTRWHVRWEWPFEGNTPLFSKIRTDYSAIIHLPRWIDRQQADRELQQKWDAFLQAVIKHESQHVLHIRENHSRIEKRIRRAALENPLLDSQTANAIARKVVDRIHKLDRLYDHQTASGKLEGVLFP